MVRAAPASLRERIAAEPDAHTDVIDEVQKAPQLIDLLHALLEERPELRFVLTGSSALTGATTDHIQALPLERLEALADALLIEQDNEANSTRKYIFFLRYTQAASVQAARMDDARKNRCIQQRK